MPQLPMIPSGHFSFRILLPTALLAVLFILAGTGRSYGQILYTTGTYTQNFDSLPSNPTSTATGFTFVNNSSLLGWYSSVGTGSGNARASSGATSTTGTGLYDWGAVASSDRSLGTFTAQTGGFPSPPTYIGAQVLNNGTSTFTSVTLSYNIEQWRRNVTQTTLTLEYLVTGSSGDQTSATGYTSLPLSTVSAATGSSFGGLVSTTPESLTIAGIIWAPGDYLWLRWSNDQGAVITATALSVDDFSLTAAAVPEPSSASFALLALGLGGALRLRRARRSRNIELSR